MIESRRCIIFRSPAGTQSLGYEQSAGRKKKVLAYPLVDLYERTGGVDDAGSGFTGFACLFGDFEGNFQATEPHAFGNSHPG
jgi:hypothetical protein